MLRRASPVTEIGYKHRDAVPEEVELVTAFTNRGGTTKRILKALVLKMTILQMRAFFGFYQTN
ncbi:hypothetical protein B9D94_18915 [Paenibacillus sp. Cedars]|nr:hypothetical protein B9D94_18915 [Paenibacillus sp. Cedars]